jgi:transposase-like protein
MKTILEFKTLTEFTDYFCDEATCLKHFTESRFQNGEFCPHCQHDKIYLCANGKRYHCAKCKQDFTIRTRTVFGESKLPLRKWYVAVYLLNNTSKGISSVQLAKHLGVTQKTAWFMAHRIRAAAKQGTSQLSGTVEVDETYVGGLEKNKSISKRNKFSKGRSTATKTPVLGMIQRGGELRANVVKNCSIQTIQNHVENNVKPNSEIHTDEFHGYDRICRAFTHNTVAHGRGEYVNGKVHTNTIEGFWAIFKRGYHGVYHWMSRKHMQRYVDEFVFRYNRRESKMNDMISGTVNNIAQTPHLGYKELIQKTV